ncbi:MAG: TonB-dependent receptor [Bacteroidota bacterium]
MWHPKRRFFYPLGLFFFMHTVLFGQYTIEGRLTDDSGRGLAYANVVLVLSQDSSMVLGDITDDDGQYRLLASEAGEYRLQFSQIGYTTRYSEIFVLQDSPLQLPSISLSERSVELAGVDVVARKPIVEQLIDRTIINVQNNPITAGNSALEVLEKSPGMQVDRGQGVLSLFGKEGLIILINGRRSRMEASAIIQMLDGMPAANIERIELITSPPAEFDADGDGGVINIILRDHPEEGFNSDMSVHIGRGRRMQYGASANFNYRRAGLNLYGNLSSSWQNLQHLTTYGRTVQTSEGVLELEGRSPRLASQNMYQGQLGLDIDLSERTVIGILTSGYLSTWDLRASTLTRTDYDYAPSDFGRLSTVESNDWLHWMVNANLQHRFAHEGQLSLDFDYLSYVGDNPADYQLSSGSSEAVNESEREFRSRKRAPIEFRVLKMDYQFPSRDWLQLSAGIKATLSQTDNDLEVADWRAGQWVADPFYTELFEQEETILAAYVSAEMKLSERTNLKLGLRNEYFKSDLATDTDPDFLSREYNRLFPSFFLEHQLTDEQRLGFSYSQRITRPTLNALAPALFFWGPNTVLSGNPALQRTITNSLRLEYRWRQYQISVQYSEDELPLFWGQPFFDEASNQLIQRAENMQRRTNIGFNLNVPVHLTDWWETRTNVFATWMVQEPVYEGTVIRTLGNYWEINHNHSLRLPMDWNVEIGVSYIPSFKYGFNQVPERLGINFGVQKKLPNRAGQLSLNWTDMFSNNNFWATIVNRPDLNLVNNWTYQWEGSIIRLTYSRSLGSDQVKAKRNRQTGSVEEQSRVE